MFKIGDLVTRKSYNNDIVFRIVKIKDDNYFLNGEDYRLCADSKEEDLLIVDNYDNEDNEIILKTNFEINNERSDYFYLPGKILHIDSDKDYLNRCLKYYKKAKIYAVGIYSKEEDLKNCVVKYAIDINPDIIVITGHDSNVKNNSKHFCDAVRELRKYEKDHEKLIIVAGACQSNYEMLIKSGANFASSPKRINIHALDPAIIATELSLTDKNKPIDLKELLSKTSNGPSGIGGIKTSGVLLVGYPR